MKNSDTAVFVTYENGCMKRYEITIGAAIIMFGVCGSAPDLSHIRAAGGFCCRAELDNKPLFNGFLSPMWDGGKLRYETQEVYDMLSC